MWGLAKRDRAPIVVLLAHSMVLDSSRLCLPPALHSDAAWMLVAEDSGKELESSLGLLGVHFIREATSGRW